MRLDEDECEDGIHMHLGLFNNMTGRILNKQDKRNNTELEMLERIRSPFGN